VGAVLGSKGWPEAMVPRRIAATITKGSRPGVRGMLVSMGSLGKDVAEPHRIVITPFDGHLEVKVGSEILAETDRALVLAESGLVDRYYVPRDDIRMELLHPTDSATTCPFKGQASYWSVKVDGATHPDLAWSYETPIPSVAEIEGLICFYNNRVELVLDGQPAAAG
jgi:uncharacterized protein (DUF427 family)